MPVQVLVLAAIPCICVLVNDEWAIDGAIGGSGAEFINDSCEPNLRATFTNNRILLSSICRIAAGRRINFGLPPFLRRRILANNFSHQTTSHAGRGARDT
jgi:hypothetical protein